MNRCEQQLCIGVRIQHCIVHSSHDCELDVPLRAPARYTLIRCESVQSSLANS
jgi:hypothetical protein